MIGRALGVGTVGFASSVENVGARGLETLASVVVAVTTADCLLGGRSGFASEPECSMWDTVLILVVFCAGGGESGVSVALMRCFESQESIVD